ncbi:MAG TPA: FAD-dependent oxidoreductase [Methylomirabilota bacterium]|jgi:geranylgeranyl reductase family protein|nr:FAD-dependent oxidoreductase [Methylomirabilota bacterium]
MRRSSARLVDVVVVGAGPAGAATAILLAERGHQVLLLDRARFPRDKVCGEYLSPEGSRLLDRLGVLKAVETGGARPLRGMRIVAPDGTALVGDYPTGGAYRGYRDHALSVPRRMFDAVLVERARGLVTVREGFRVTDLIRDGERVAGVEGATAGSRRAERIPARLVVGADGRTSVVARQLALLRPHPWLRRLALMTYAEGVAHDPERGEIFLAPPAYSIVNPVGEGRVNLSLVVPAAEATRHRGDLAGYFDRTVAALPHLSDRLRASCRVSPVRALGPLAYRVAAPRHAGVLLVGDALGFLDPFTGEGIFTALRSAELAAEVADAALRTGDVSAAALAPAHARRLAAFAAKERVCVLLQRLIVRRRLATIVARRLARRPDQLALLMGVIGDFVPAREVLSPGFLARLLL